MKRPAAKHNKIEAALWYCRQGLSVIPCRKSKKPYIAWTAYQKQAASEDQIREWWQKWPTANPAIVCGAVSGVMVVDADSDKGIAAVNEFLPHKALLPVSKTPSGGQHFYFRYRPGLDNRVRALTDCDVRTEGGYVLAPAGVDGYAWLPGLGLHEVEPAEWACRIQW